MLHGLTGIASLVYVFTWLSELLESPEFLDAARHAMRFLTPEAIAADLRFDVLSGAAGSILSLLRLGDPEALAIAETCANHLLEHRCRSDSGHFCWSTFNDRPISGQAHGNSGISLALLRLARILSRNIYRDAAVEALEFENSTFSEEHGNWPDLRWDATSFAAGWCHGGPGMSLARIEALTDLNYPRFRQDIEFCITAARQNARNGADHICCGNFGRILLLDEIAQTMGRPDLAVDARQFASWLVMRARQGEGYRMMRQYSGYVTFPSVFQGSSGICLALLRLTYPASTPNIITIR
jgi:lantibiotic modifying enzyme